MFRSTFQGGPFVELFQAKQPSKSWVASRSSALTRVWDDTTKTYVMKLDGPSTVSFSLPGDRDRHGLGLVQHYVCIQASVSPQFSVEFSVIDSQRSKRRIIFSPSFREIQVSALHAQIPLSLPADTWLNAVFDVAGLTELLFRQPFTSLEGIILHPQFLLRSVFTLRDQPPPSDPTLPDEPAYCEPSLPPPPATMVPIPVKLDLPATLAAMILVVGTEHVVKLRNFERSQQRRTEAAVRRPRAAGQGRTTPRQGRPTTQQSQPISRPQSTVAPAPAPAPPQPAYQPPPQSAVTDRAPTSAHRPSSLRGPGRPQSRLQQPSERLQSRELRQPQQLQQSVARSQPERPLSQPRAPEPTFSMSAIRDIQDQGHVSPPRPDLTRTPPRALPMPESPAYAEPSFVSDDSFEPEVEDENECNLYASVTPSEHYSEQSPEEPEIDPSPPGVGTQTLEFLARAADAEIVGRDEESDGDSLDPVADYDLDDPAHFQVHSADDFAARCAARKDQLVQELGLAAPAEDVYGIGDHMAQIDQIFERDPDAEQLEEAMRQRMALIDSAAARAVEEAGARGMYTTLAAPDPLDSPAIAISQTDGPGRADGADTQDIMRDLLAGLNQLDFDGAQQPGGVLGAAVAGAATLGTPGDYF